jgi:hypothetical protein
MKTHLWAFALIALLAGSTLIAPASALDCPTPQPLERPGVLKETRAQIEETGQMLSSGDLGQQVQAIVTDLRSRYPHAENAELVNYIVTAYCPVVDRLTGLSEPEKKAKMDNFVMQLMQKIY